MVGKPWTFGSSYLSDVEPQGFLLLVGLLMSPPKSSRLHWIGHTLFWPALAVWTWKLVQPNPVPEGILNLFTGADLLRYLAAKTLHLSGNTFLTLALGWWVPRRRAPLMLAFTLMLLHGLATEIIQTFVPHRTGLALDVLIDWAGVWLGVFLGWRWWRPIFGYKEPDSVAPPPSLDPTNSK